MVEKAKSPSAAGPDSDAADYVIAWRHADGTEGSSGPWARERAESIVEVYGRMYPGQTFWVEPLPKQILEARPGRVRRVRRFPTPEGDH